jgi:hypothetical protein
MKGWFIPAPAPWANTTQALAAFGRLTIAETFSFDTSIERAVNVVMSKVST